jgi:hypothetical protein
MRTICIVSFYRGDYPVSVSFGCKELVSQLPMTLLVLLLIFSSSKTYKFHDTSHTPTHDRIVSTAIFPESSRPAAVKWTCEIGLRNTRKMVSSYGRLNIDIDLGPRSRAAEVVLLSDRGSPFAQEMCWKKSLNARELRVLMRVGHREPVRRRNFGCWKVSRPQTQGVSSTTLYPILYVGQPRHQNVITYTSLSLQTATLKKKSVVYPRTLRIFVQVSTVSHHTRNPVALLASSVGTPIFTQPTCR